MIHGRVCVVYFIMRKSCWKLIENFRTLLVIALKERNDIIIYDVTMGESKCLPKMYFQIIPQQFLIRAGICFFCASQFQTSPRTSAGPRAINPEARSLLREFHCQTWRATLFKVWVETECLWQAQARQTNEVNLRLTLWHPVQIISLSVKGQGMWRSARLCLHEGIGNKYKYSSYLCSISFLVTGAAHLSSPSSSPSCGIGSSGLMVFPSNRYSSPLVYSLLNVCVPAHVCLKLSLIWQKCVM